MRDLTSGERFDVLVIGGGVIGSAIALDAAGRGLRVALVERKDFAAETSSRSTKLLHGGIRYLPHFEFGLVREGLLEQKILVRTADYLYKPLDFIIPLYRNRGLADLPDWASIPSLLPAALRAGLWLYDTLGSRSTPSARRLSDAELGSLVPRLRRDTTRGGFVYGDALTDDARLTMAVLKTAVTRHDAVAVSRMSATGVSKQQDGSFVVRLSDHVSGDDIDVAADAVVSATWAFAPPPYHGANVDASNTSGQGNAVPMVLSKGVHLLFHPEDVGLGDEALVLPETDDGRVLFLVPWRGSAIFGTTDTPYDGPPGEARADEADVDYLMRHLHQYLDVGDIEPRAAFAGVRALVGNSDGSTGDASRAHEIVSIAPGYLQVVGGKLTAYRAIAVDAVDTATAHLGLDTASRTHAELVVGAGVGTGAGAILEMALRAFDLPDGYGERLIERYGTESAHVVDILEESPEARTVIGDGYATVAEVLYVAQHEAATSIADVALRRTHLAWAAADHGRSDARTIANALGGLYGWSDERRAAEITKYETELQSEGL